MRFFKMRKRLIAALLVTLLVTFCATRPTEHEISKRVAKSIVRVDTLKGTGTGFFITKKHIITNFHVVGFEFVVKIDLEDGKTIEGTVIAMDPINDLAIIELEKKIKVKPLKIVSNPIVVEEEIRVIHHAFGSSKYYGKGTVTSRQEHSMRPSVFKKREFILFDAPVMGGASGSPLMNTDHEVVGVVTAMRGGYPTFSMAGTAKQLKAFIKKSRIHKSIFKRVRNSFRKAYAKI